MADEAVAAKKFEVLVITGASADATAGVLKEKQLTVLFNPLWETGMGSGISAGVKYVTEHLPQTENIIIASCDQPFVSSYLFLQLLAAQQQTEKGMVACSYSNTKGIPALFGKKYFSELMQLKGNSGAKQLFTQHENDTAVIPFPEGNIDIDTEEAYQQLITGND